MESSHLLEHKIPLLVDGCGIPGTKMNIFIIVSTMNSFQVSNPTEQYTLVDHRFVAYFVASLIASLMRTHVRIVIAAIVIVADDGRNRTKSKRFCEMTCIEEFSCAQL